MLVADPMLFSRVFNGLVELVRNDALCNSISDHGTTSRWGQQIKAQRFDGWAWYSAWTATRLFWTLFSRVTLDFWWHWRRVGHASWYSMWVTLAVRYSGEGTFPANLTEWSCHQSCLAFSLSFTTYQLRLSLFVSKLQRSLFRWGDNFL